MKRPLTDEEKKARKDRAKRRREAKAAGTYVPRSQRKALRREQLTRRVLAESRPFASRPLKRKGTWIGPTQEPAFKTGEPVLIKAVIRSHMYPQDGLGIPRYMVEPIESIADRSRFHNDQFLTDERCISKWPRKKKTHK